jgi:thiosulfate/3-mercaptopyruvate sulfurtransferase
MKKTISIFLVMTLVISMVGLLTGCGNEHVEPVIVVVPRDTGERAFPERWVNPAELQELKLQDNVVVVDFSESPDQVIPGAIWINRSSLYRYFEGNIWDIEVLEVHEAVLGAHGICNHTLVIVYCDNNSLWATRMAWNLKAYGLKDVRILEGGTKAWLAAGGTVNDYAAEPREPREFVARMNVGNVRADSRDIFDAIDNPNWAIVDVRTYGEQEEGRIVSAITFRFPEDFIDLETGLLFPREHYEYLFRDIPRDSHIIAHCSGGTRTSTAYFIFIDILGWPQRVLNYNGSWQNWSWLGGPYER